MERASVERQAASAAAATIKAMGGHLNKRGESSGSVTEAEEESNHSSFDTATTASLATTPGSGNATAALGGSLRPSTGAGEQDGGGRRREPHGSGATVTSSLSSGSAVASAGPLASPPLTSEPAAAGGATEAGAEAGAAAAGGAGEVAQQPPGTQQGPPSEGGAGGGGGEAGGGGRAALPVLQPPDEGTPAAEALAANAAIPHRGRGTLSRAGSMSMGRKNKSLRRLARNLQKKKKKKQRRNFQGNVIKGEHEQYTLTIGMMLGIRVAVGRPQQMDDLTLMDFMQVDKYLFPPKGCNKPPHRTPPHHLSHDFKFKDYAPKIFHRIRQLFGIDSASYMLSVSGNYNYLEFMSNSKSGQFFFYSHDGRFMIKTQTPEENKFLRKILPHYYQYVSLNPDTLLTRFYGMHRVKMRHLKRKVHFVIMHSVFDTKEKIYRIYDIKGSTVGRSSGPDRLRKEGVVYKDLDLVDDKVKFQLGTKRRLFMEQLEKDASFLASLNIMDYSLLIGIHDKTRRERDREDSLERPGSASAAGGDGASSSGAGAGNSGGGGPESLRRYHSHHSNHHGQLLGASPTGAPLLPPAPSGLGRPRGDSQASAGEAGAEGSHGGLHHQQAHHHHFHHHHSYREARDRDGHGGGPPTRSMREFSYESSSAGVGEEGGTTVGGSAEYDEENYQSYDDSDFDSEMSDSDDDIPPPPMMPTGFSHPSQGHSAVSHGSDHTPLGLPTEASILTSATNERRLTHRRDHGVQSRLADGSKGNEVYFVGIIDILQQYNSFKRAETFFKSFKYDSRQISAVEPAWYARRFVDFCAQHIS